MPTRVTLGLLVGFVARAISLASTPIWLTRPACSTEVADLALICTPWEWHTPMAAHAMRQGLHAASEVPIAFEDRSAELIPLGRPQSGNDMAEAVLYLAGAENVTGIALTVAGGMEMN